MNVSIIIVTKDRWELLEDVVEYLQRHRQYYKEIVVINNASKEDPPKSIKAKPNLNMVKLPSNVGVSEGRNIGAVNAKGDLLCFIDDDGYLDMSKIDEVKNKFEVSDKLGVVSFGIKDVSQMQDPTEVDFETDDQAVQFVQSHTFQGGACLINKEAFVDAGMYPEDFHYGTEERDLSMRLIDRDYSIEKTEDIVLLHYNPSKAIADGIYNPSHYYRNTIRYYWRNYPLEYAVVETALKIPSAILRSLSSENRRAYAHGLLTGLLLIPSTIVNDRDPVSRDSYKQQKRLKEASLAERTVSLIRDTIQR